MVVDILHTRLVICPAHVVCRRAFSVQIGSRRSGGYSAPAYQAPRDPGCSLLQCQSQVHVRLRRVQTSPLPTSARIPLCQLRLGIVSVSSRFGHSDATIIFPFPDRAFDLGGKIEEPQGLPTMFQKPLRMPSPCLLVPRPQNLIGINPRAVKTRRP